MDFIQGLPVQFRFITVLSGTRVTCLVWHGTVWPYIGFGHTDSGILWEEGSLCDQRLIEESKTGKDFQQ